MGQEETAMKKTEKTRTHLVRLVATAEESRLTFACTLWGMISRHRSGPRIASKMHQSFLQCHKRIARARLDAGEEASLIVPTADLSLGSMDQWPSLLVAAGSSTSKPQQTAAT